MAVKKITRRWIFNNLSIIIVILLAVILISSVAIQQYFYSSVKQLLISESVMINTMLDSYSKDSSVDFNTQLLNLVGNFEARDKMELMMLDLNGNAALTSSGFQPDSRITADDYTAALANENGTASSVQNLSGEKIMAVTVVVYKTEQNVSAMRFLVSMNQVDRQVFVMVFAVVLLGIAIIFFVVFSSSYFINSIVNPVVEVGETARAIAQGNFNARLNSPSDDEIGELCDTINYMAEELENADRLKNDFISSVSHELRTPLTAIKGWAETMQDPETDMQISNKGLQVILRETDRLSGMVEELLDFSRMQSGRFKLVKGKMDLLAELGEAVLMYTERAKREKIELIYDEMDDFIPVFGDKNKLRQVFINIIDNALKYSNPGDTVRVDVVKLGDEAVITVADTGLGIKPEDLPNIKTKFYKANLTRRGSGIGLAVADEIVMMHGGRLDIESTFGEGTTVTITIPFGSKEESVAAD